jgi:hypothetical protein
MSFTNSKKKNNSEESHLVNEGARESIPLFLSNDQKTRCPGRHEHNRLSEVVYDVTRKLFLQGHDSKQCSALNELWMDKVQKHNSFNTNTPSSESYRNHLVFCIIAREVSS